MALDPVSFVFAQVLQQIEWLHEGGHISPETYAMVIGNLVQSESDDDDDGIASPVLSPNDPDASFVTSPDPSRTNSSAVPPRTSSSTSPPPDQPPGHPSRGKSIASRIFGQSKDDKNSQPPPPPPPQKKGTPSPVRRKHVEPPPRRKAPSTQPPSRREKKAAERKERIEAALDPDEPELGRVNKAIRNTLGSGMVLGTAVDQALALTTGVPGVVRERMADATEEKAHPWIYKMTDPRNQAKARGAVAGSYSSLKGAVRKGSKKEDGVPPVASGSNSPPVPGAIDEETGGGSGSGVKGLTLGPYATEGDTSKGESAMTVTSVHAFMAAPDLEITAVVTAAFLPSVTRELAKEEDEQARQGGEAAVEG